MNNFLSQLDLTPQERRIVAIIFLVVIVVLNFLFVWPHFGEWGSINRQLGDMRNEIAKENRTIAIDRDATNGWQKQVATLIKKERKEGSSSLDHSTVDPQVQLQNTILAQERKTGVLIKTRSPGSVKTNDAFFEEHSTTISLESQEPQLVSFLYNMGNDPAMIRVAKLDLKPVDANRYKLNGSITLTANYAKKSPTAGAHPAAVKPAPAAKSAAKPPTAPGAKPAAAAGTKPAGPPATPPVKRPPAGPPAPGARPPAPGAAKPPTPVPRRKPGPDPSQ